MLTDLDPPSLDLPAAIAALTEIAVAQAQAIERLGDVVNVVRYLLPAALIVTGLALCASLVVGVLVAGVR